MRLVWGVRGFLGIGLRPPRAHPDPSKPERVPSVFQGVQSIPAGGGGGEDTTSSSSDSSSSHRGSVDSPGAVALSPSSGSVGSPRVVAQMQSSSSAAAHPETVLSDDESQRGGLCPWLGEGGKETGPIEDGGAGKVDGRGFISMEASNYGNAAHQAYLQWRAVSAMDGNSDAGGSSCSDVEEGPDFW